MGLLRTRFCQESIQFVSRKGDAALPEVLTDFPGVFSLAACNSLCQVLQLILFWIKPIAEHIRQFISPRGTHFHCSQEWEPFFHCELLQLYSSIHTIMVGDGNQAEPFTHKIVDQLFRGPRAIAVGSMHLEVNSGISRQDEMRSQ